VEVNAPVTEGNNLELGLTQSEQAYMRLRTDILFCKLQPGCRVTEVALADDYGMGRAAIRTALNRLYQERLVQPLPRQGYVVAPITLKGVRELFEVRILLEPASARMAAGRVDPEELCRLDQELRDMRYDLGVPESAAAFLNVNAQFHSFIARASGNDRLADLVSGLLDEMTRLFQFGLMLRDRNEEMYHEHHELIRALLAGDGDRAEQIAREQIITSRTMVIDALLHNPRLESLSLTGD
jgi:DNA-binding GntR family transcriptional regulator